MKNVQKLPLRQVMRISIAGAAPLKGWAVKYVSGIEGAIPTPGDLLCQWQYEGNQLTFAFDRELRMCFNEESAAKDACTMLRDKMEIETEIIKVG